MNVPGVGVNDPARCHSLQRELGAKDLTMAICEGRGPALTPGNDPGCAL